MSMFTGTVLIGSCFVCVSGVGEVRSSGFYFDCSRPWFVVFNSAFRTTSHAVEIPIVRRSKNGGTKQPREVDDDDGGGDDDDDIARMPFKRKQTAYTDKLFARVTVSLTRWHWYVRNWPEDYETHLHMIQRISGENRTVYREQHNKSWTSKSGRNQNAPRAIFALFAECSLAAILNLLLISASSASFSFSSSERDSLRLTTPVVEIGWFCITF